MYIIGLSRALSALKRIKLIFKILRFTHNAQFPVQSFFSLILLFLDNL